VIKGDQRPVQILLTEFTGKQMFDSVRNIYFHHLVPGREDEYDVVSKLIGICNSLTEVRNKIVHGSWFIGFHTGDNQPMSYAKYYKHAKTAKGIEYNFNTFSPEMIGGYADTCDKLSNLLLLLIGLPYPDSSAMTIKKEVDSLAKIKFEGK
jgi:hypothetical protein